MMLFTIDSTGFLENGLTQILWEFPIIVDLVDDLCQLLYTILLQGLNHLYDHSTCPAALFFLSILIAVLIVVGIELEITTMTIQEVDAEIEIMIGSFSQDKAHYLM